MSNETFICYSRRDREFVDLLFKALEEAGFDSWLDRDDIAPASFWEQEVLVAIQACHNFVYVISPDSLISVYCNGELNHALALNKRIIPLVARPIDPSDVRPAIAELNWIWFDDFQEGLKNLILALEAPLGITWSERLDSRITVRQASGEKSFFLYRDQYCVGRSPSAEFAKAGLIRVRDRLVSRIHCTLLRRENRWFVVDGSLELNHRGNPISFKPSTNGLSVAGQPVGLLQFRPLVHGDILQLSQETAILYEEMMPERGNNFEDDDKDTQVDDR